MNYKRDSVGRLSYVFWMSNEQITLVPHFPYLLLRDDTYQSNTLDLSVALFVGEKNFSRSLLFAQAMLVGEKTRDFVHQFSNLLVAVGMAHVVLFTDACVKASNAAKTVFPDCYHFSCYWHTAENAAKNLTSKLGHEAFKRLEAQMPCAHRQKSFAAFHAIWEGIILDQEFAPVRDYLFPLLGGGAGAEVGTLFPSAGLYKKDCPQPLC